MKNKDMITFICVDDKAKVECGESNLQISSGAKGNKSIVPCTTVLGSLDHDINNTM